MPEQDIVNILQELSTHEVSLVKSGANRRVFAVIKHEEGSNMDPEVLSALMSTPAEGEDELKKSLETNGLDEKAVNACIDHYRFQKGTKDLVGQEAFDLIAKTAGYREAVVVEVEKEVEVKKEELPEEVRKALDDAEAAKATFEAVAKAAEERANAVEDKLATREYLEKATASYSHLGDAKEIGDLLKTLHAADAVVAEKVEAIFAASEERIAKGDLFDELGHNVQVPSSAEEKLDGIAKEMVSKSEGQLSYASAYDKAMQIHPELYAQHVGVE